MLTCVLSTLYFSNNWCFTVMFIAPTFYTYMFLSADWFYSWSIIELHFVVGD